VNPFGDIFDSSFFDSLDPKTREFFAKISGEGCSKCGARKSLREFPPASKSLVCGGCAIKIALGSK
jgi:hypothetical protein